MLVVNSAIGLFYYVRIIVALYSQPAEVPAPSEPTAPAAAFALAGLVVFLFLFGIYPAPVVSLIQSLVVGFP